MKGKRLQVIGLIVLLLLLVGAYLGLRYYNQKEEAEPENVTETVTVLSWDMDEVDVLSYDLDGETVSLVKEEGAWHLEGNREAALQQDLVNRMLVILAPLYGVAKLDAPGSLEEYGLENPSQTIRIHTAQGEAVILVGDKNSLTGYYYLKREGEDFIYAVESGTATVCSYSVENLLENDAETGES